eukprot:2566627-Alexandrium_andersonii.AAC.1
MPDPRTAALARVMGPGGALFETENVLSEHWAGTQSVQAHPAFEASPKAPAEQPTIQLPKFPTNRGAWQISRRGPPLASVGP